MKHCLSVALSSLALLAGPVGANGSSAEVNIGGVGMSIESPAGFVEISILSPETGSWSRCGYRVAISAS